MLIRLNAGHRNRLLIIAGVVILIGCIATQKQTRKDETRPGVEKGYLPLPALPNSKTILPEPPAEGSAAMGLDESTSQRNLKLRGTPRWQIAAQDAVLSFPSAAETFTCAVDAPINEKETPRLFILLRRSLTDAGLATYPAKIFYKRPRPFMVNHQPTCTPDEERHLRNSGSYPSGHTSVGWAWALILAEIAPDRADAILVRGRAFGESRLVCNVHWHSDVVEGRFVGAATVAKLHSNPAFLADLEAAKAELAAVRARGLKPTRDCEAELQTLKQ